MDIDTKIRKYKKQIISKAKKTGVWENFGQTEVSVIEHFYEDHQYKNDGVWDKVRDFDNWCENYTGE